jgi:hypothetical protein
MLHYHLIRRKRTQPMLKPSARINDHGLVKQGIPVLLTTPGKPITDEEWDKRLDWSF